MEKLGDGQIDLRQTRLFTDLVGKVHEQRTRRCHYQQACQERWRLAIGAICRSRRLNSNIPKKVPNAK
jgi:hypothetical protein